MNLYPCPNENGGKTILDTTSLDTKSKSLNEYAHFMKQVESEKANFAASTGNNIPEVDQLSPNFSIYVSNMVKVDSDREK